MVSLIVHALLGLTVIGFIVGSNPQIFRRATTPAVSTLECVYYIVGIASVALGWYFNVRFVLQYSGGGANPIWGPGSWADYVKQMFVNSASSSASQDYTFGNVILLPLWTIVDGRRRGVRRPWLYFVVSLFTSFAFAWAFYLATVERQRRTAPPRDADRTPSAEDAPA
jgi:Terpene cyclase DEP1